MHCLLKGSAVHLYQYMVYAYCAVPWRFHAQIVKNLFEPIFCRKTEVLIHLKTVYCFIGINAIVCQQCPITMPNNKNGSFFIN